MQTFLPYESFEESARVLDWQRLGKQRAECLQILKALADPRYGWQHHPAVNMWRGYSNALARYGQIICLEWIKRGYVDTCYNKISVYRSGRTIELPVWLGQQELHVSHQSQLMRKLPEHYGQYFSCPLGLEYVWPT